MGDVDKNSPIETESRLYFPCFAKVITPIDLNYQGTLQVQLLKPNGDPDDSQSLVIARMISPFAGHTSNDGITNSNDYDNTQKSYGMWMVPPDPGTIVMVIFARGMISDAYWIGVKTDSFMNFSLPGLAATAQTVSTETADLAGNPGRVPVAEYNKAVSDNASIADANTLKKPTHPFAKILKDQGLIFDDTRGITTSSSRREFPSTVFGLSTPGPLDMKGPKGKMGPSDSVVTNYPLSRLGGATFVFDDGDVKHLRKTSADKGPPDYASVWKDETSGDTAIPHNELIRLRTRTGHQILLHNSEDLIYIGNAKGTAWVELTSNGKIDIFAADSISVHSKADINFYADRDVNFEAGRNVNIKSNKTTQLESNDLKILVTQSGSLTTGMNWSETIGASHFYSLLGDSHIVKAGGFIDHETPSVRGTSKSAVPPVPVKPLQVFNNVYDEKGSSLTSILKRIPNVEPWTQHENLDPLSVTSAKTDITNATPITFSNGKITYPDFYKVYTTKVDPFNPPPAKQKNNGGRNNA